MYVPRHACYLAQQSAEQALRAVPNAWVFGPGRVD